MDEGLSPSFGEDVLSVTKASYRLTIVTLSFVAGLVSRTLAWLTFSLPRFVYAVLSWGATFTLRLNFAKVAISLLIGTTILSYAWKVRYLNRYTFLKEQPLKKDEGLDLCAPTRPHVNASIADRDQASGSCKGPGPAQLSQLSRRIP